jgi:hypothetical protein
MTVTPETDIAYPCRSPFADGGSLSTKKFGVVLPPLIDDTQRRLWQLRYAAASNEIFHMDPQVADFELDPIAFSEFWTGSVETQIGSFQETSEGECIARLPTVSSKPGSTTPLFTVDMDAVLQPYRRWACAPERHLRYDADRHRAQRSRRSSLSTQHLTSSLPNATHQHWTSKLYMRKSNNCNYL